VKPRMEYMHRVRTKGIPYLDIRGHQLVFNRKKVTGGAFLIHTCSIIAIQALPN
jgi:hypothetical protein